MILFPIIKVPAWTEDAACRDISPAVFFPDPGHNPVEARAICAGCAVKTPCLEMALANESGTVANSRHGVYAGLTPTQRAAIERTQPKERTT